MAASWQGCVLSRTGVLSDFTLLSKQIQIGDKAKYPVPALASLLSKSACIFKCIYQFPGCLLAKLANILYFLHCYHRVNKQMLEQLQSLTGASSPILLYIILQSLLQLNDFRKCSYGLLCCIFYSNQEVFEPMEHIILFTYAGKVIVIAGLVLFEVG